MTSPCSSSMPSIASSMSPSSLCDPRGLRVLKPDRVRWNGQEFASAGAKPKLSWIAIDRLRVDETYQRPVDSKISRRNIDRIVREFQWAKFGTVIVAPAHGGHDSFAII